MPMVADERANLVDVRAISKQLLPVFLVAFAFACSGGRGDDKDEGSKRSSLEPGAGGAVDASIKSEAGGVVEAMIAVASPYAQVVRASQASRIAGATATFAPGSFDIDSVVTIEPGDELATSATLGIAGLQGRSILSAGASVMIYWAEDRDAAVPFTMAIPAPTPVTQLQGAGAKLYVLYSANVVGSQEPAIGGLTGDDVKLEGSLVSFSRVSYGLYQAVYLSDGTVSTRTSTSSSTATGSGTETGSGTGTETEVGVEDPYALPPPKPNPNKKKPTAFSITAPTDELSAKAIRIKWELSDFATSFDVTVASDAGCTADATTITDVEALMVKAQAVVDGDNFVCVVAKGEHGSTPASNNGFKFRADIQGPEKPSAPTITLDGNIGIHVEWQTVQDLGEAGLVRYGVEIATATAKAKGMADVFNSEVTGTTQDAIGFSGQTYYARVRGIDAAGNEGPWSDWSAGLELP